MTLSTFDKWVKQNQTSGSFKEKDNRSPDEAEMIKLRKEIQQLKMENDILNLLTKVNMYFSYILKFTNIELKA